MAYVERQLAQVTVYVRCQHLFTGQEWLLLAWLLNFVDEIPF